MRNLAIIAGLALILFYLISRKKSIVNWGEYHRLRQYKPIAVKWGGIFRIPVNLILATIWDESKGIENTVGSSGEKGLMQLMEIAVVNIKLIYPEEDFSWTFDKDMNIKCGTAYLAALAYHYQLRQWDEVIVGYNSGPDLDPWDEERLNRIDTIWVDLNKIGV